MFVFIGTESLLSSIKSCLEISIYKVRYSPRGWMCIFCPKTTYESLSPWLAYRASNTLNWKPWLQKLSLYSDANPDQTRSQTAYEMSHVVTCTSEGAELTHIFTFVLPIKANPAPCSVQSATGAQARPRWTLVRQRHWQICQAIWQRHQHFRQTLP